MSATRCTAPGTTLSAHSSPPGAPRRRASVSQTVPPSAARSCSSSWPTTADRHDQHGTGTSGRHPRPSPGRPGHQRHSQQRGGRARRATRNLPSRSLFDDAARLLIRLLYQRQVCSMNVLSDLLEVTATCIGDTVKQTREALEDHGHTFGAAPSASHRPSPPRVPGDRYPPPARAQILKKLSHPALTGISRPDLQHLTERLAPRQLAQAERLSYQRRGGPRQSGPAAASSTKRSATASAALWPSSTSVDCARWTSSPTSSRSAGPRSATPSARPARSSNRPGTPPHRHQPATAPPRNSWPP